MNAPKPPCPFGWVREYKGSLLGGMDQRRQIERWIRGDETLCAVVPADEWDALTDVDAAVERAARVMWDNPIPFRTGYDWDSEYNAAGRKHFQDRVRPIVLAALGITE